MSRRASRSGWPSPLPTGLVQLEWCAAFTGPVRAAIHALKYRGERRLAEPLGAAIAERWGRAGRGGDLVVPVPVHPSRLRERGFDQAEDLARVCGRAPGPAGGAAPWSDASATTAQHALGREERAANVGGAFASVSGRSEGEVRGRWVVLVDDVSTTGATLSGCALALLRQRRSRGLRGDGREGALTVTRIIGSPHLRDSHAHRDQGQEHGRTG